MSNPTFNHILVPVDFSETGAAAISHAALIAKKFNSQLTLIHVKESFGQEVVLLEVNKHYFQNEEYNKIAREKLEEIAHEIFRDYNIMPKLMISSGRVATEVANIVEEEKVDMVVMGTHGTKGLEEFFLGSNAFKVVSKVNVPVLTVRPNVPHNEYQTIVMPLDNTFHTREKVIFAALFATIFKSKIIIPVFIGDLLDKEKAQLNLRVKQVENYLTNKGIQFNTQIYHTGKTSDITLDVALNSKADLIVIMTDQEEYGFFSSSAAQKVVNHSPIPVLNITPSSLKIPKHMSVFYKGGNATFY